MKLDGRFAVASQAGCWLELIINPTISIFCSLLLFTATAGAADGDFVRTLTPEETQSAGLTKLSPAERARLEELVERYRAGRMAVAEKAVEARSVEPAKSKKLMPDWVGALIILQHAESKPAGDQTLESRLTGDFTGWSGRSTFRLENGQLWAQANGDSYDYSPALHSPKVKIYPASFGSYWLEVEGCHQKCRVKPVKLQ